MKKLNKLLMVLFLCATVSACGGGNDDAEQANLFTSQFNNTNLASGCGVSFACNGTKSLADFRNDVLNMRFGPSFSNQRFMFEGWERDINFGDFWIFDYNYTSFDSIRFRRGAGANPIHEEGSTQSAIRDHLLSLIDAATQFAPLNNQVFDVQVGNNIVGAIYRIDLSFPIEANPIIKVGTKDGYYFSYEE